MKKKMILSLLLCSLFFLCAAKACADSQAPQDSYTILLEDGKKLFHMAAGSPWRDVEEETNGRLQSGLYDNTTPPANIYHVDFSSNPFKCFPVDYAYKDIILSNDGMYFADIPWAISGRFSGDDELGGEAVSFYANGSHVKTYTVRDLLKDETKAEFTASHVLWEDCSKRNFDANSNVLTIATLDGIVYSFYLPTGDLLER